jgi:hypothetical protein
MLATVLEMAVRGADWPNQGCANAAAADSRAVGSYLQYMGNQGGG